MRTEDTLDKICMRLQRNCADELEACTYAGVSLVFLDQWCKDDKTVHERVEEAKRVGSAGLYTAAVQRGVHGVEEDVYYKGMVVGQKRNYSDTLLGLLLKAKVPEFSKDSEAARVSVNVQVANIMPRAENYEQWLAMKQQTLAPPANTEEVIEAEFTPVPVLPDLL